MDRDGVLDALEAGDFDGISHAYEPYSGHGKNSHQKSMRVSGGTIEVTTTTYGKFFDGKENTRFEDSSTESLTGIAALDFIAERPYYFEQARPDLFEERLEVEVGFVAQYRGTCVRCGAPIQLGQVIQSNSAGRYEHVHCP
jgi:hypothetical protein